MQLKLDQYIARVLILCNLKLADAGYFLTSGMSRAMSGADKSDA